MMTHLSVLLYLVRVGNRTVQRQLRFQQNCRLDAGASVQLPTVPFHHKNSI